MIKVNESFTCLDLGEALVSEVGIFEAKRGNQTYRVISRAGHSITSLRPVPTDPQENNPWRVRKIGELRAEQDIVQ